jgi:hemoglobin
MGRPSIYEYAGAGAGEAFLRLADKHHERCLADPELNHPFSHADRNPQHIPRLAAYWAEVFGGPAAFPGGHSAMLTVHSCQEIPDDFSERFLACFVGALDDAKFPADVKPAMTAYMQAAIQEVALYAPKGSVVPQDLPTPQWGWDGPIG